MKFVFMTYYKFSNSELNSEFENKYSEQFLYVFKDLVITSNVVVNRIRCIHFADLTQWWSVIHKRQVIACFSGRRWRSYGSSCQRYTAGSCRWSGVVPYMAAPLRATRGDMRHQVALDGFLITFRSPQAILESERVGGVVMGAWH